MNDYFNINVKQIPENGMDISCVFPASEMDIDFRNFKAVRDVSAELNLSLVSNEIIIRGRLSVSYMTECDRCLQPVEIPVNIKDIIIAFAYKSEDFIDISPEIRDEILLAIPTKILCVENCRGLCPGCRANLNHAPCQCVRPSGGSPFDSIKI